MKRSLKRAHWTKDEKRIVDLLLEGETEFLTCLRGQLSPPFFVWAERRTPTTKPRIYSTPPNEYVISIVYDGALTGEFGAGDRASLQIDDLTILEGHGKRELQVIGTVDQGILINVRFLSDEPIKWPRHLQLRDWHYCTENGPQKQRLSLSKLDIPIQRIRVDDLAESWVRDILVQADRQGLRIGVHSPAEPSGVADLTRWAGMALPADFGEFLGITNGVNISGTEVFGCDQAYLLEGSDLPSSHLLVFALSEMGDPVALDLSQMRDDSVACPVIYIDHESDEVAILAESFEEWLTRFVQVALEEQGQS